jgi:hypothetical protein
MGKIVEKAGHVIHSAGLAEKGRVMREEKRSDSVGKEGPFAN